MAHASNIAIPARFIYRPYRAEWEICQAEIVGWALESVNAYKTELGLPSFLNEIGQTRLTAERVQVLLTLRNTEEASVNVGGLLSSLYRSGKSYTVEIKRTEIPAEVLQPNENPETTPDIAGREFYLLACQKQEFQERLSASPVPDGAAKDARTMRDEFWNLKSDVFHLRRFLSRWGLWSYDSGYEDGLGYDRHPFVLVAPERLWAMREHYRKAAMGSAHRWLSTATPLSFRQINEIPYFVVERSYCEDAIKATITIDHLSNVKFGICKRKDCREIFERTTEQKRFYCSPECAHLANVRKLRKEKKKAESKGRNHATRKNQKS